MKATNPTQARGKQAFEVALQQSGCCLVLLSPTANGSAVVEEQWKKAQEFGLRIFPVIGRGDEWSAIPKVFIGTQIIDVRTNHDTRMNRLIERIREHLGIAPS